MTLNDTFRGTTYKASDGIFADPVRLGEALYGAWTMADVLRNLGLRESAARRAQLSAAIKKHRLPLPGKDAILTSRSVLADADRVKAAVRESSSSRGALAKLGLSTAGKNYERLHAACRAHGVRVPRKWGVREQPATPAPNRRRWEILSEDPTGVAAIIESAASWTEVRRRLGWRQLDTRDRKALLAFVLEHKIASPPRSARGKATDRAVPDRLQAVTDEQIRYCVQQSSSMSELLRCLDLPERYRSPLKAKVDALDLVLAKKPRPLPREEEVTAVFQAGSGAPQQKVRNLALRLGKPVYQCARCGMGATWQGESLTLVLDHINGDPTDHRFENLRFMCPNCESQSPTHGSKNRRNRRANAPTSRV